MKKIISLCLILHCSILSIAQTTNTFPTSGNVGIGTASPTSLLELSFGTNPNFLKLTNTASGGKSYGINPFRLGVANSGLEIRDNTSNISLISFDNIGNVGIGTASPTSKLHVQTDGGIRITENTDAITRRNTLYVGANANGSFIKTDYSNGGSLDLIFQQYNTEVMRIKSGGNVGIGTSTPKLKLDVKSSVIGYPLKSGTTQSFGTYRISSTQTDVVLDFGVNGGNDASSWIQATYATDLSRTYNLLINPNGGNVCIGTIKSFGYKLAVNGTIGAKEVKVEATSEWPDFVFKPNYNLRPLSEVEQFIKTNNHLPEIPSEAEVKENGIGLGEMNAKLLQKVEELTLYLIEQNKKIEIVIGENQELKKEIQLLKQKN